MPSGIITDLGTQTMPYYRSRIVELPFDETVQRVTATLKEQGFGVLTDIDGRATLKTKLSVLLPYGVIVRDTDHATEAAGTVC